MSVSILSTKAIESISEPGENILRFDGWIRIRTAKISSSDDAEATVDLPSDLDSENTLRFLGFAAETAFKIFDRYVEYRTRFPQMTVFELAKSHVRSCQDVALVTEDWASALDAMGIQESLRNAILHPDYEAIRLTESASYWVLDTIHAKWLYLSTLESAVLKPKETPRSEGPNDTDIELLKGSDFSRLQRAVRLDSDTDDTFTNRLENTLSRIPGDFSGDTQALYFSQQRAVALYHADYARLRIIEQEQHLLDVGILHLIVPKALLDNHVEISGDVWKEYVMRCRLQLPIPEHLRYISDSPVVLGSLLPANDHQVAKLVGKELDYTALEPLRLGAGNSASQYCLKGVEFIRTLNEQSRLWLEILPKPKAHK